MTGSYILPIVLFLPLLGALFVLFFPRDERTMALGFGIGVSVATFLVSLGLLAYFKFDSKQIQVALDVEWISALNAHFKIGLDGVSLLLVLLTTFLMPIVMLASWNAVEHRARDFVAVLLILQTGMIGAFIALDVFLFYVFWEIMLIPMFLLIGIWGGQRRLYASVKFVLYTMIGSLLMLAAIFYVYAKHGQITGNYTTDLAALKNLALPYDAQVWCFAAFALAFAIKVPLFPLHTWLPDAHVEAPTSGSVILAGVMLKFGVYGLFRFAFPLFPHGAAELAPWLAILSVIGIVYGALVAFAQDDVKKLVAYSSVSHLGFCVLGLTAMSPMGIAGSFYAMLSHGLTTSGLFLAIGMLYERRHTRRMDEYGGVWKKMPIFGALFLICTMGSAGLPALSGFVGEFLSIFGTFVADKTFPMTHPHLLPYPMLLGAVAATGVILGAVYLLYMFQKVMFGPITNPHNQNLRDVSVREILVFLPVVLMIFVMGIVPQVFLKVMNPAIENFTHEFSENLELPDGPVRLRQNPHPEPDVPQEPDFGNVGPVNNANDNDNDNDNDKAGARPTGTQPQGRPLPTNPDPRLQEAQRPGPNPLTDDEP